jgi:RNA recognition motif-containing protein
LAELPLARAAVADENSSNRENNVKTIFVGNLSSNRTPDELRTLFQSYGAVEQIEIMTDINTGYSRGFAFIEMTNDLEAANAVANLNGAAVWGNPLKVEEAQPKLQHSKPANNRGDYDRR